MTHPPMDAAVAGHVRPQVSRVKLDKATQRRLYVGVLLISDSLMILGAFSLAYRIRFLWFQEWFDPLAFVDPARYGGITLVLIGVYLGIFALFRLYHWQTLLGGVEEYARAANACTVGAVGVMVFSFLVPEFVIARGWLVVAWALSIVATISARALLRHLVYHLRTKGYFVVPALVLGTNDEAISLAESLSSYRHSGLDILGFVDNGEKPIGHPVTGRLSVIGRIDQMETLIDTYNVEELVIASSALSAEEILEIFRRYGIQGDVAVRLSSGLFDVLNTNLHVKELGLVPLITVNKVRLSPMEAFVKGMLDRVGALVGLLLLSPFLVAIAVAIKLTSPGPILYRRRVVGQGGKLFDALKFRTMYTNGDQLLTPEQWETLHREHKLKDDPRVTPIGRFLRKYSLDELPQLWNVLKGEMSLIGPRMITLEEQKKYGKWDANLMTVKPGMSGLWQVSGRSDLDYSERIRLDMQYIRNYSIWLDIQLIVRTIFVVLTGRGAY